MTASGALFGAILATAAAHVATAQERALSWDVTSPRGPTRIIEFTTDQGTWTSVDIAPDGSWIVFDLLGQIYRIPASGGQAENLTEASGTAINFHPRISPDGREIAFVSDRNGQHNLWVMNADGTGPRVILADMESRITEPAWAPDGRSIVAVRNVQTILGMWRRSAGIWQFQRDGGEGRELLGSGTAQFYWPAFSPDGRHLYFHTSSRPRTQDGLQEGHHIARLDLRTGTVRRVTNAKRTLWIRGDELKELAPEISPDGRWLAFARRIPDGTISFRGHRFGPRTALWLRDLRTGAERILMDPIELDMTDGHGMKNLRQLPGYAWAPDSRSLVVPQGGRLRRVWVETGAVETIPFRARVRRILSEPARSRHEIGDGPLDVRFPQWHTASPDGRVLAFTAVGRIWLMDLPAGPPRRLTGDDEDVFELTPAWSPDGRALAFVTWSDEARGHLWVAPRVGGGPRRVSAAPGEYLYPAWSPDGRSLIVVRGTGATARGEGWSDNPWYEIVRIGLEGGEGVVLHEVEALVRPTVGADGRIYFVERTGAGEDLRIAVSRGEAPAIVTALRSVAAAGGDARDHVALPHAPEIAPSPDGRWIAFREGHNIWLAPVPAAGGEGGTPLVDRHTAPGARRLTDAGGLYPRWRGAGTLEYSSGTRYFALDIASDRVDTARIRLRVPRDVPEGGIALTGARVITLAGDRVLDGATVVVRAGRIACVGRCDTRGVERVLELRGRTVVPGFVDVHAHRFGGRSVVIPQRDPGSARYLAYGVTTTLDPSAPSEVAFATAELVEAGRIVGPRSFTTGEVLNGFGDQHPIRTYADARSNVDRLADWGAISIKDFLHPRRDHRQMLVEAARARGVTATAEGADLYYNLSLVLDGHAGWEHPLNYAPLYADATTFFGMAGIVYSPTLLVGSPGAWSLEYWLSRSDLFHDPKERRFTPWRELLRNRNVTARPLDGYSFPFIAEGVADIKRAGGRIAIGDHGEVDGRGSHWEIWNYATALTPIEALEAASMGGAYMLGLEDELGSIEPGKLADLLVLDADPLEDIRNTLSLRYVMKAGVLYDAATLDRVWPDSVPYGARPWADEDVLRRDDRPIDRWDRAGRPPGAYRPRPR